MLSTLISQSGNLLTQASELLSNPLVSGTAVSLMSWFKNTLGKKSSLEKIDELEKGKGSEASVNNLQIILSNTLEDNEKLQQELKGLIEGLHKEMEQNNIPIVTKENNQTINGNDNIALQDITVKGDIIIKKNK